MKKKIRASEITRLLGVRHKNDVFVPECKNGPTHTASHRRLDAWVMSKSWSKPLVTGYEIKVSRSDFLSDDKWHDYLDYCNEFYFVTPYKMISPDEIPAGTGLLWVSKHGVRLFKKRAAEYRDIEIPQSVFRYILMCRAHIQAPNYYREGSQEYWSKWLENKKIDYEFGYRVSKSIRAEIDKEIKVVGDENKRLQEKIKSLETIKTMLEEAGINIGSSQWSLINSVRDKLDGQGKPLLNKFNRISEQFLSLGKELSEAVEGPKSE